jgi:hypothetical protein
MFTEAVKVKIKTAATEARYIKKEEHKKLRQARYFRSLGSDNSDPGLRASVWDYVRLREHRKGPVAIEARTSLIAYGYIRGKTFDQIENPRSGKELDVDKVAAMVYKYANTSGNTKEQTKDAVLEWMESE